jgi:hypothetical protein
MIPKIFKTSDYLLKNYATRKRTGYNTPTQLKAQTQFMFGIDTHRREKGKLKTIMTLD